MAMIGLGPGRRDVEIFYTRPGQPCRRPGINEGDLTLVAINEKDGVMVIHTASRTAWWGQQNHYCPAGFSVFTFDPAKVKVIDNERRIAFVSIAGQCEFQSLRKTWGDETALDARLTR